MNISSIWYENLYKLQGTKTQSTGNTENSQSMKSLIELLSNEQDDASFSAAGMARLKMPPPPEEMDFENMSDDDLKDYLQRMQDITGFIPGATDGVQASDLTEDQLASVREKLAEMKAHGRPQGRGPMQVAMYQPPEMSAAAAQLSDDDLTSLLEAIQKRTGSIPGVEESDAKTDASALTQEQLQSARDALLEMMQQRMMSYAASAYYQNSTAVSV